MGDAHLVVLLHQQDAGLHAGQNVHARTNDAAQLFSEEVGSVLGADTALAFFEGRLHEGCMQSTSLRYLGGQQRLLGLGSLCDDGKATIKAVSLVGVHGKFCWSFPSPTTGYSQEE